MSRKIHILSLLFGLFISCSILAACKKDECIGKSYSFKTTWKISPEKDSINIGDTLNFYSDFNTLDYNTNLNIVIGNNATVSSALSLVTLKGNGLLNGAVDSFDFIQTKGNIYTAPTINPSGVKQLSYLLFNNIYQLQFALIARKKGIYAIGAPDGIFRKQNAQNCNDEGTIYLYNSNINNNLHYYRDLYYQGAPVPAADSVHGYSFKVR